MGGCAPARAPCVAGRNLQAIHRPSRSSACRPPHPRPEPYARACSCTLDVLNVACIMHVMRVTHADQLWQTKDGPSSNTGGWRGPIASGCTCTQTITSLLSYIELLHASAPRSPEGGSCRLYFARLAFLQLPLDATSAPLQRAQQALAYVRMSVPHTVRNALEQAQDNPVPVLASARAKGTQGGSGVSGGRLGGSEQSSSLNETECD